MKKLLLFFAFQLLLVLPVFSQNFYPDHYDDHVNDFAKILTQDDSEKLQNALTHIQKQTGIQIVVVTINSLSDYNAANIIFRTYAASLFDHWGIGDKSKNNGVLVFFSLKDREVRIEMGYGYAHAFDDKIQKIVDETMLPLFKNGEYSRGLYAGTSAVINVVTKKVSWFEKYKRSIILGVLLAICVIAGISCIRSGKKGWGYAFFAAAAALLFFFIRATMKSGSGGNSKGYGGGRSGGGGGGGKW